MGDGIWGQWTDEVDDQKCMHEQSLVSGTLTKGQLTITLLSFVDLCVC